MKKLYPGAAYTLVVMAIAFLAGRFSVTNSREIHQLRPQFEHMGSKGRVHGDTNRSMKGAVAFGGGIVHRFGNHPGRLSNPSGLVASANITKEDLEITRELERRGSQGEFILHNESPFLRKVREKDFLNLSAQTASNNSAIYNEVFSELGIQLTQNERLQKHLEKIHKASLEAEEAIAQLLDARMKYDKRMRSLLSEDDYSRYREHEALKPAWKEVESIQQFLKNTKNTTIAPQQEEALAKLIRECDAAELGSWHGPYDPLPQVRVGKDEVMSSAREQLQITMDGANRLLKRIPEVDPPDGFQQYLAEYYTKKIEQRRTALKDMAQMEQTLEKRGL